MADCFVVQPIHPAGVDLLRAAGHDVRFASSPDMAVVAREIGDARAVITRDAGMDARAIGAARDLGHIASHGVGVNRVDLIAARARQIMVTNTPQTNVRSVAEHTIGLMFALARRTLDADAAVRAGDWGFRYQPGLHELHGKTLGLVGFGTIARAVASMARHGLGMTVLAWSPRTPEAVFEADGVARVPDLPDLLQRSDVVSLHRPLRADTITMIDDAALRVLRPGALLINTGRGGLIDVSALGRALADGRVGAAALDVFTTEPPAPDDPVLSLPRTILTPHIGGTTEEAMRATSCLCARQVIDRLAGRTPDHVVA
ncbi:D-3-phosphoglycerate dehydrogenase [Ameyamaea chiangmaiensis NBRC 103196]|uniref:Hydroxyacid dehydrogenase n=1 Tax=Ameyamaea chiangmaiensis TaxID=442969 RepID=A0A850PEX8_9PROT|nr:hydroxyacid dehydrogenase [Ameyamaea chiangmaiensis]MBS4076126.1 hydroxyacid dehydrogenase [Ameyamaea chiangmaiensis]NVN39641.1 hydroxyacid dehydrogenase [Ameyamaea chiangmaiensis]GBQ67115.1 D-3-phosphoglycerate dehydrogenase [Ameyamaea chiangmaiensis NBRC 103196]